MPIPSCQMIFRSDPARPRNTYRSPPCGSRPSPCCTSSARPCCPCACRCGPSRSTPAHPTGSPHRLQRRGRQGRRCRAEDPQPPAIRQIKNKRGCGVGRWHHRLVDHHRRHKGGFRLAQRRTPPLVDQAASDIMPPRHVANPRTRLKRIRKDPLAPLIAPATATLRSRQYRHLRHAQNGRPYVRL